MSDIVCFKEARRKRQLEEQVQHVCNRIHGMLAGEDGLELGGPFETERIVLELPKGFVYLATYLARMDTNHGHPVRHWDIIEEGVLSDTPQKNVLYRGMRKAMRRLLTKYVLWELHRDVEMLNSRRHPLLSTAEEWAEANDDICF